MAKLILICGKICNGKTTLAKALLRQFPAVLLSTDEATFDLIANEQGEFYNVFAERVNRYLRKKAVEIVRAGADVILDWGFWTARERRKLPVLAEYTEPNLKIAPVTAWDGKAGAPVISFDFC